MKVAYSWLKEYVGDTLPDPDKVEELLTFHSFEVDGVEKVGDETVIDVDVLPNRASDCLCHRGIARELASVLDTELDQDPLALKPEFTFTENIQIDIEDSEACPRFTASLLSGVTVKESPDWLKKRLEAIGVRSINNIVDATNYVMFALGEPLHAYDADLFPQVEGVWKFKVRRATAGEEISLLAEGGKNEDRVIECDGTELLVVDASSDTPIGLAGIKGGKFAGVHEGTKNIIIEAAHFNPTITRKTARRLNIVIDGSKRFENEPSRELPPYAQKQVIELIKDIAGGEISGYSERYPLPLQPAEVIVTRSKTNSLLGLSLSIDEIASLIKRIGADVTASEDALTVTSPFERTDLQIEEDYIEEVGRLYGLDKIESVVPQQNVVKEVNSLQYYTDKIRNLLNECGFSEVITYSFHKKGKIQLQNALASDKSYVRSNLRKNIENSLDKNYVYGDLLGIRGVKIFEIGTIFLPSDSGIKEQVSLAVGVRTKGNGYSGGDDKQLETVIKAINDCFDVSLEWVIEKGVAETNLDALIKKLPIPEQYVEFAKKEDAAYVAPSPYPPIARDIALWVPEDESPASVEALLRESAGPLLYGLTCSTPFPKMAEHRTHLD